MLCCQTRGKFQDFPTKPLGGDKDDDDDDDDDDD